jgi:hypothetical protein
MFGRLVTILILVPLAIVLVALAVANRAPVAFTIDPFNPGNPGLTLSLPLFVLLFAALALGLARPPAAAKLLRPQPRGPPPPAFPSRAPRAFCSQTESSDVA